MIVHTWVRDYRMNCFSFFFFYLFIYFWLSHHCEMWLSLIRKVQEPLFVFRQDVTWMRKFWRQDVTEIWSLHDMSNSGDVIASPEEARLQKKFFFFKHSNHCYANWKFHKKEKKRRKKKRAGWLPKNRQKGQIALSDDPFRCRVALWSDTKRDMQQKIMSYFRRNQIEEYKAVRKRNNSTSLDSSPV